MLTFRIQWRDWEDEWFTTTTGTDPDPTEPLEMANLNSAIGIMETFSITHYDSVYRVIDSNGVVYCEMLNASN